MDKNIKTVNPIFEFEEVKPRTNFVDIEHSTLLRWQRRNISTAYLSKNSSAKKYHSFIDGPITANNSMGVHHAWGRSYKDIFQRYKNMQGFQQRFQNGFDGQGLWVEVEVEKEKGFASKKEIENYGIDKFVNDCKERVKHFAGKITQQSKRLGYFMDWNNSYHTMSDQNNYTIWYFLKKCHENGWLYEGEDVMPWCPRCGTGLSQHEIVTDGYKRVNHPSLFVKFPLVDSNASLLVWTTTPWTLAANIAVAVNPEDEYVKIVTETNINGKQNKNEFWLSANRLSVIKGEYTILKRVKGSTLSGLKYNTPFIELPVQKELNNPRAHTVVIWKEVSNQEGTGIVHIAPGAGKEDFLLGQQLSLPVISPLSDDGYYKPGFGFLSDINVRDSTKYIYQSLRQKGLLYKIESINHNYPHCWRCGSELVFRLVSEWFISMKELRPMLMNATSQIQWIPSFGRERELDWLKNMSDWMISKKRYWGLALPIFKCSYGCVEVIGSLKELEERSIEGFEEFRGHSPHRPWIDKVKIQCRNCKGKMTRIKDVGNPWLDAGIVGFSTLKYNNDKPYWDKWFPADWISESFPGQFRNWFYSLIAMSVAISGKAPTKTIFSYALMRDENGDEMHKSQGNAIWFEQAAEEIGVDVMRWLFTRQSLDKNLNFGYKQCDEVRRKFIIPIWNVYSFFITYAKIDGWTPNSKKPTDISELDRWILSELNKLIESTTYKMDNWQISQTASEFEFFVDILSKWYIRRSRRRFWKNEIDDDKRAAYFTLHECLTTLCQLLAPFIPFITDEMYNNLTLNTTSSVHLTDWPQSQPNLIDDDLIKRTRIAINLSSVARAARAEAGIKVRQPLQKVVFGIPSTEYKLIIGNHRATIEELLKEELNIHSIEWSTAEQNEYTHTSILVKLNYRKLGPKYGSKLKAIEYILNHNIEQVKKLTVDNRPIAIKDIVLNALLASDKHYFESVNRVQDITIQRDELIVENTVEQNGLVTSSDSHGWWAGVSTKITPSLLAEGLAREISHRIQNLRKTSGLNISDRIQLTINTDSNTVTDAVKQHSAFIKNETLAVSLQTNVEKLFAQKSAFIVNNQEITISLELF